MYNKYTIEVFQDKEEAKAKVFLGKDCLGTVWRPSNTLNSKQDYIDLFQSIGSVVYGQENKIAKKEESDSKLLEILAKSGSPKHP